jgi:hypothetical protein
MQTILGVILIVGGFVVMGYLLHDLMDYITKD